MTSRYCSIKLTPAFALLLVSSVALAQSGAENRTQDCKGISVELVSVKRTGQGDITAEFQLQNGNNDDRATFANYGRANGNNTYLIDNTGTEWPKKKAEGNGNRRQALMAGIRTKYKLTFHLTAGGNDATSVNVIYAPHILPLKGVGTFGYCNLKFANISLDQ